jgi:hypothetical protein
MKRKIQILVSIIIFSSIIAAATFGFQLYQPTSLQWLNNSNINSGDVVNIYFTINNNLPSLINSDEDDIISDIINSAKMWSMFSSKANINIILRPLSSVFCVDICYSISQDSSDKEHCVP